jgi:hypothetical protein
MQQILQMFEKMYEEKRKNEEQASLEFHKGDDMLTTITQIMIWKDSTISICCISTLLWHVLAP